MCFSRSTANLVLESKKAETEVPAFPDVVEKNLSNERKNCLVGL